jgi:hypothetical protein
LVPKKHKKADFLLVKLNCKTISLTFAETFFNSLSHSRMRYNSYKTKNRLLVLKIVLQILQMSVWILLVLSNVFFPQKCHKRNGDTNLNLIVLNCPQIKENEIQVKNLEAIFYCIANKRPVLIFCCFFILKYFSWTFYIEFLLLFMQDTFC